MFVIFGSWGHDLNLNIVNVLNFILVIIKTKIDKIKPWKISYTHLNK